MATVALTAPARPVMIDPAIYGEYFEHVEDCFYPGVMDAMSLWSQQDVLAVDTSDESLQVSTSEPRPTALSMCRARPL